MMPLQAALAFRRRVGRARLKFSGRLALQNCRSYYPIATERTAPYGVGRMRIAGSYEVRFRRRLVPQDRIRQLERDVEGGCKRQRPAAVPCAGPVDVCYLAAAGPAFAWRAGAGCDCAAA